MSDLMVRERGAVNYRAYLEGIKDCYTENAKTLFTFLGLKDLTVGALWKYFEWLNEQGYRASTIRIKRQAALDRIRRQEAAKQSSPQDIQLLEWTISELNKSNHAPKMQFNSIGVEKVLTLEEYRKALKGCKSDRQAMFIRFLYSTGARVSEMTGIRLTDCSVILGTAYITVMGKGKKERGLRIPEALYTSIRETFKGSVYLFETSKGKPYARQYVSHEISKVTARSVGRKLSAHKLRHSWATRQLAKGTAIDSVSRYMGHADTTITLKYYAHNEITNEELFDEDL